MRILVRVLIIAAAFAATTPLSAKPAAPQSTTPDSSAVVLGSPSWAPDGQPQGGAEVGFSPLSVTQSGVAYSPAAPAAADETSGVGSTPVADLPAWASAYAAVRGRRPQGFVESFSARAFGNLPEPAAWVLILLGVAMIAGALRGLIQANRRLVRLRSEDHDEEE